MHPANKPDPTDPITIRPLTRDDFPLLHRWLNADHVQTWWHGQPATPTTIERKYGPRVDGVEPTRVFVIQTAGRPVGIIQCYRHADHPAWNRAVGIRAAAGIDYLIGAPPTGGNRNLAPIALPMLLVKFRIAIRIVAATSGKSSPA